jgi:hypothetical protein
MADENLTATPRYRLAPRADGEDIVCVNSPNIRLRIQPGVAATKGGLKRYPRQSIFLDGAYSGPPFLNNKTRQYSLDHHSGCVRSLTLASCEQAAVMVFHGIPLHEGDWLLLVNGVDLDAILAAWLLMNSAELRRDGFRLLGTAMPFVRLEGVIDSHGLEAGVLGGLSPEALADTAEKIKGVLPASRLPAGASLEDTLRGTVLLLERLDALLLPEPCLRELAQYLELGRVALARGKFAVACRSVLGIYEVENYYKARYGSALGLVLLDRGAFHYSLRLASDFLDLDLNELYKRLNRIDPAASASREAENRWGGSSDIGGSPRLSGSQLGVERILAVIGELYGERSGPLARVFTALGRR